MNVRTRSKLVLAIVAAALCGCATTEDAGKPVYQGKEYRTGSNIAVRDGDVRGEAVVAKPDDIPPTRGPWQTPRSGPGSGNP